jgi:hypothetical protein
VNLDARAVQFVFERRLAQRLERAAHIARGVGQHRLHRLEGLQHEPRQRVLAIHERRPRDRRKIAGQHRRPADTGCCNASGLRDRVDQDAFLSALAELAEQEADQEILLVAGRLPEESAQQLGASRRGSGA